MDAALRHHNRCTEAGTGYVSILVLMDAALRPHGWTVGAIVIQRFNPCFNGCRPATEVNEKKVVDIVQFQSLF